MLARGTDAVINILTEKWRRRQSDIPRAADAVKVTSLLRAETGRFTELLGETTTMKDSTERQ